MLDQNLAFPDACFDVAFSSAVLEHVVWGDQVTFFVLELLRTCLSVFLTTPDRPFSIEVHTFLRLIHWLPKHLHP
jgi:hypothetical protein